jgi:thioredoxin 1
MKEVTDLNFKEVVLDSKKPVIVDFYADWCGPCKAVAPLMEILLEQYKEKIDVVKCNVDISPIFTTKCKVFNIPTVMFFKDGEIKDKQVGSHQFETFVNKINEIYEKL